MTKSIAPEKPSPLEIQKTKLIEAWTFKSMREQEIKGFQEESTQLQEKFKEVQAKLAQSAQQKRDADVAIQTLADMLKDFGVNANEVLEAAFAPPAPEPESDLASEDEYAEVVEEDSVPEKSVKTKK